MPCPSADQMRKGPGSSSEDLSQAEEGEG